METKEKIIYNFDWIDEKVKEFKKTNKNPNFTVKTFVDGIIYPHGIFLWFMPGEPCCEMDDGYNNFLGDEENYLEQLKEYVKKYRWQ